MPRIEPLRHPQIRQMENPVSHEMEVAILDEPFKVFELIRIYAEPHLKKLSSGDSERAARLCEEFFRRMQRHKGE